jgi:hypothetical protein
VVGDRSVRKREHVQDAERYGVPVGERALAINSVWP